MEIINLDINKDFKKHKIWTREGLDVFKIECSYVDKVFTFEYEIFYKNMHQMKNELEKTRLMVGMIDILRKFRGNLPDKALSPISEENKQLKINYEEQLFCVVNDVETLSMLLDMHDSTYKMMEALYEAE